VAQLVPIFTVLFDYTQSVPTLVLTDPGTEYPGGVATLIQGFFYLTQPDGLTRSASLTSPDIAWNGSALNAFSMPLRLDCDGKVQLGTYTITYSVQATGYTGGSLTYTFLYDVVAPTGLITASFDVFTPALSVSDATNYTIPGYSTSISRTLSALINAVSTSVTTTGATLPLVYNGSYYDSAYSVTLAAQVLYTSGTLSWLTALVNIAAQLPSTTGTLTANTPPTCVAMSNQLIAYQNTVNTQGCDENSSLFASLTTAQALLNQINTALAAGTYTNLYALIVAFENIVSNNQYAYTNTNVPIAPYNYTCGGSGSGGGGGNVIVPISIQFTVGDSGYGFNGLSAVTFPSLATGVTNPKSIVVFAKGGTVLRPGIDYTFTPITGGIALLNGAQFTTGEGVYIYAQYPAAGSASATAYQTFTITQTPVLGSVIIPTDTPDQTAMVGAQIIGVTRDGLGMQSLNAGRPDYYSFNLATGQVTINTAANGAEIFQIQYQKLVVA